MGRGGVLVQAVIRHSTEDSRMTHLSRTDFQPCDTRTNTGEQSGHYQGRHSTEVAERVDAA
jgi:hypothetical protein